eukprot:TRINITY_DN26352_c0_g2_i2.p1 TRINITY_DN26352_c0_g2~~TRINITY_DN26352_c0_g2_i2.p1  ORF type:complete len:459 (-),score=99.64 TRINITY_DN26352_c0_g2_i2:4-1380(-)
MGCGSSSGYLTYEIDPFVGTPANENDNPPSSIYQMKRRKSDSNLRGMMKDPVVGTVFRDFLAEEMKEHLFLCWIDVEQYNLITDEQDIAEKQRTAAHIFNAYFEQNGPAEVQLDTATRMQIREVLQLREGIVNQRDFKLLKQAFFLAHQKIFTQLKFEYMPRFLSHRKFLNLSHSKKYFEDQPEVDHAAASILTDINLDYTLEHPLGTYFFKQFLQSPEARDIMPKTGEQLLELIAEIEDYRNSESAAHRFKRAFVIFHRFHKLDPSVHAIKEKADAKPRLFREPAADIFNKALATVRSRLEEDYFYEFKESAWFAKLGTDVCQIFPVPPSVRIQQLKKFALERNYTMKADAVDDAIAALDLPQILGDCMGAYYFKTFAHKHFLEEYVDFWLRVHQLRTGIRNPTTNSIMMSRTLSMTHGSLARSSSGFLGWGDDVQSVETEGSEEEVSVIFFFQISS